MSSGRGVVVDDKYCFTEETNLTVHKTCVFLPGDAFIVYDPNGQLIFRFDSYGEPKDELVLMDASGKTLITLLRKVRFLLPFQPLTVFTYPNHRFVSC